MFDHFHSCAHSPHSYREERLGFSQPCLFPLPRDPRLACLAVLRCERLFIY